MGSCPDATDESESRAASFDGVGRGRSPLSVSFDLPTGEFVRELEVDPGSAFTRIFRRARSSIGFSSRPHETGPLSSLGDFLLLGPDRSKLEDTALEKLLPS